MGIMMETNGMTHIPFFPEYTCLIQCTRWPCCKDESEQCTEEGSFGEEFRRNVLKNGTALQDEEEWLR